MSSRRRIALVHDWLTGMRGGEKVLDVLCELFPAADIFTLVHVPGQVNASIEKHKIFTSPLQKIPGIKNSYRHFLPLMPWAIEQLDLSAYDLVISTSHCVAKGVIPAPQATHWCYCHTPMRYIWDQYNEYFGAGRAGLGVRLAMGAVRPLLQRWDLKSTDRVTHFLANSKNVQERIQRIYHRESRVLYPPVDYDFFSRPLTSPDSNVPPPFSLIVSALAPYKRVDIAVDAFNRTGKRLIIIGDGPEMQRLRAKAGPHISFLGWLDTEPLRWHYAQCRALIFPGEEDFGIVPLEAMSAGKPVIAYRKGGALETVIENKTGVFFDAPTAEALISAVSRADAIPFNRADIQGHAERFSRQHCLEQFRQCFVEYVSEMS